MKRPFELSVTAASGPTNARRLINAHLHLLHLNHMTLSVHAVAVLHPARGTVVLLGGHGAGKTLTGVALGGRGWSILAGDSTLLDYTGAAAVRGGTQACIARRDTLRRWFPQLAGSADAAGEKVEVAEVRTLLGRDLAATPAPIAAAVVVDVDGDPQLGGALPEEIDRHTAETIWLRASAHLLDRVLEADCGTVLRLLENAQATRRRAGAARVLAATVPMFTARGTPQAIASQVESIVGAATVAMLGKERQR